MLGTQSSTLEDTTEDTGLDLHYHGDLREQLLSFVFLRHSGQGWNGVGNGNRTGVLQVLQVMQERDSCLAIVLGY